MVEYGTIIKGGEDEFIIILTDSDGWLSGADAWTWKLLIADADDRMIQLLALVSSSAAINTVRDTNDTMTVKFPISCADSESLDAGNYVIECQAIEDDDSVHYYDKVNGTLRVREPDGANTEAP